MIEAVVFDLDGTLAEIPIDYEELIGQFRMIVKSDRIRPITETVSRLDQKKKRRVFKVWSQAELSVLDKVTPRSEGIEVYEKFSDRPKALVTMQGRAFVESMLRRLKWRFDVIITREDSLDRTEQLMHAARELRTPSERVLFVGNTEGDQFAAEKIGCQFFRIEKK